MSEDYVHLSIAEIPKKTRLKTTISNQKALCGTISVPFMNYWLSSFVQIMGPLEQQDPSCC